MVSSGLLTGRMGPMSDKSNPVSRFATTRWSVVLRAGGANSDVARNSLDELIQTYWYPLYAFARRTGCSDHDAMDLTQGFFVHVLQNQALEAVSPDKGRFRSFLLAAFKNFCANDRRAASAIRRGGDTLILSLSGDEFRSRYDLEPATTETAEQLFDRKWIEALLDRVRTRLAEDYQKAQKSELFTLLEPHLTNQVEAVPRTEICRRMNLSAAAVAMSLHRMRRRYGDILREEVAATVDHPEEIEQELRDLMLIVSSTE